MKHILLPFIICLLFQCKVKDKPQEASKAPMPPPSSYKVNPDECLLQATVREEDTVNGKGTYIVKVQNIIERGFGFSQNIKKGDLLEVRSPTGSEMRLEESQKLKDTTSVVIVIEFVPTMKKGHYRINDIIE